jgi:hypothetical protein
MNAMGTEVDLNGIEDKIGLVNNNRRLEILCFFHLNCTKLNCLHSFSFHLCFFIMAVILIQVANVWSKHDQRFTVLKTL